MCKLSRFTFKHETHSEKTLSESASAQAEPNSTWQSVIRSIAIVENSNLEKRKFVTEWAIKYLIVFIDTLHIELFVTDLKHRRVSRPFDCSGSISLHTILVAVEMGERTFCCNFAHSNLVQAKKNHFTSIN